MKEKKSFIKKITAVLLIFSVYFYIITKGISASSHLLDGAIFFFDKIFPSVFPFVLLSKLLIDTSFTAILENIISKNTKLKTLNPNLIPALCLSVISGFPTGAIMMKELYEKKRISKKEADIFLAAVNNASPGFVTVIVGQYVFDSLISGFLLWLFSVSVNIFLGIMLLPKTYYNKTTPRYPTNDNYNFSSSFIKRTKESVFVLINIFSLNLVFYFVSRMTNDIFGYLHFPKICYILKDSVIEMGCGVFSSLSTPCISRAASAFAIGFGGLCVMMQIKENAHENADMKCYFVLKLISGALCSLFAFFVL